MKEKELYQKKANKLKKRTSVERYNLIERIMNGYKSKLYLKRLGMKGKKARVGFEKS